MSEKQNQLTIKTNFEEIGKSFKSARKNFLEEEKKAMSLVDTNTKKEKDTLEKAYAEYNKKVDKVLSSNEYKTIQDKAKEHSTEITKNLLKAKKEFMKVREHVLKQDYTDEKKEKKIGELYQYILNKLYTKEEIDKFEKLLENMVIMRPMQCQNIKSLN